MPADFQRVKHVFLAALEQAEPDGRDAYLRATCAGDATLRAQVEALLGKHAQAGSFLEKPVVDTPGPIQAGGPFPGADVPGLPPLVPIAPAAPAPEGAGTRIGPYKLLEQIGEGGMGIVFLAEQEQPVRRQVALKVIKAGMDSARVVARFEAERQALALMDHSHIARVFDGGTTAGGRPFFVMELVRGKPITHYCDEQQLTPRQRLQLFLPICEALQHAHQKGIIHRDLKPSNVLVACHDGKPVVKVIDFGVAKATGQRLTERTLFTGFGTVVGTLEYMSPEQAELNNQDIDTRSDIYSLGVLLYELLTGTTPLTRQRLEQTPFPEVLRLIREEEPPRPSTRLSASGTALAAISAQRRSDPRQLPRLMRGDLDWIVMKALDKDRARRYDTAGDLARDIECHLGDEPVSARPPTAAYRLYKFVRRHREAVLVAALVLLALLGGIIGTTLGLMQAEEALAAEARQRQEAQANEQRAIAAVAAERQAKLQEASQRQQAEAVVVLLESLFQEVDPRNPPETGASLKEQLVAQLALAAANLDQQHAGEPLLRARLQHALGRTNLGLGEWSKAAALFESALAERQRLLGPHHPDTLDTLHNLGMAYTALGRTAEAVEIHKQVVAERTRQLGPNHTATLGAINSLANAYYQLGQSARAIELHEQLRAKRLAHLGPHHTLTLATLHNLALAYRAVGRIDEAVKLLEKVWEQRRLHFDPHHPVTVTTLLNLGGAYEGAGRYSEAIQLYERYRDQVAQHLGPDHPFTLALLGNLATAYTGVGRAAEAVQLYEQVHAAQTKKLGADHPHTVRTLSNLARAYREVGQYAKAVALYEQAYRLLKAKLGPEHPETLGGASNLGEAYLTVGKLNLPLLQQTLASQQSLLGPEHPATLTTMNNLAKAYQAAGKLTLAVPLFQETLALRKTHLGPDHPDTLISMNNLALARQNAGQLDLALFEEACQKMKVKLGPDHPDTLATANTLGVAYRFAGKLALSLSLLEETLELRKVRSGPDHPETLTCMNNLAVSYRVAGKFDQALHLFEEALRQLKLKEGPDHAHTLGCMQNLASLYTAMHRYPEAIGLLQELIAVQRRQLPAEHPSLATTLTLLGMNLVRAGQAREAEPVLRECLAFYTKHVPGTWPTFYAQALLGASLLAQQQYADAEPLLLSGYEGMKQREQSIPPDRRLYLREAATWLVQLYEATGQEDKAAAWQKKLAANK
jgi:serine/threonine protein kinase/tetratricopeptide (TPR) repeat protein